MQHLNRSSTQTGYSLLELMVALAVMAIVASQLLLTFSTQQASYQDQKRVVETQQDVRLLADVILADLRMAGFMVNRENGVGSIDGGTAAADVICMSDPNAFDDTEVEDSSDRFEGASITGTVTASDGSITLTASEMDIDGDGTNDFTNAGGILISDGTRVHCAAITNVSGADVDFTPPTPSGSTWSPLFDRAVPAIVYRLNGNQLLRNGVVISTQVEDLQIQFGVDNDNDGDIEGAEFPIDDLNTGANDLGEIMVARLTLTSRTSRADPVINGQRTAAANRIAGAADNFKRRRVTTDVQLRNMR